MHELVLILPIPSAADRAALAPALGRARASPVAGGDWRAWLASRVGLPRVAASPPAHVAAASVSIPATGTWFATPVALHAALDHVRMPANGWVTLTGDESAQLAADFAATLGGGTLSLTPAGAEGFLLSGLAANARTQDPARVLGGDIAPWLPADEGAGRLRGLGAEVEMWLYEHPLQRTLRRRGSPPVTTLWLWGGGPPANGASAAPASPTMMPTLAGGARAWPRGYGRDSWLAGLWRAAGEGLAGEGGALADLEFAVDRDTVVVVRDAADDVEARWLAPALAQLAARRLRGVQLIVDERAFRFSRFDLVKPWRRAVHWAAPA